MQIQIGPGQRDGSTMRWVAAPRASLAAGVRGESRPPGPHWLLCRPQAAGPLGSAVWLRSHTHRPAVAQARVWAPGVSRLPREVCQQPGAALGPECTPRLPPAPLLHPLPPGALLPLRVRLRQGAAQAGNAQSLSPARRSPGMGQSGIWLRREVGWAGLGLATPPRDP